MLKKIIIIIGALGVAIGLTLTNQAPEAVYKLFPGYFPDPDKAWEDSPLTPAKITESRLPASVVCTWVSPKSICLSVAPPSI